MVPARHHDSVAVSVRVQNGRAGRQAVFVRLVAMAPFESAQSVVLPFEALSQAVSRHTEMW